MSYQQQPPMGGWSAGPPGGPAPMAPMGQQMAPVGMAQPASAAPAPKRGKGLLFLGIGVAVVGLGAGAVLLGMSGSTKEETVQKFARAPAGCTTVLQFDKTGSFTVYLETKGTLAVVEGDCDTGGASYERTQDDLPQLTLTLVDESDGEIDLADAAAPTYSAGPYTGQAIRTVNIAAAGSYRLTVDSPDRDFAIAIGGDPEADSDTITTAGIAAAVAGLVLGGLLVLLGLRKKPGSASGAPAAAWPGAQPGAQQGYQQPGSPQQPGYQQQPTVPGYQPQPGYQQQPTVPGYQPQQPSYPQQPTYPPQAPTVPGAQPTYQQPAPAPQWPLQPQHPEQQQQPPTESGWGAPGH